MTMSPVGPRCPDHSGARRGPIGGGIARAQQTRLGASSALVTKILIAVNVGVYVITVVQGTNINNPGGSLYLKWVLFGPAVAHGDWWRLVTAMFLHGFLLHLLLNMLALWWIGAPVEEYLGRVRFLLLYLVSGLAGSAGALVATPDGFVVGASGAIFGILGSMLILEWQATGRLGGTAATLIAVNLALNFAFNGAGGNISIGGHIGGLIGGILVTLSFARWGRGHAAYGRVGLTGSVGLVVVAAASVAVSYLRVRGYA
jgi:membrane associated rhomboid family serine protease